MLSLLLSAALASALPTLPPMQDDVTWQDRHARIKRQADGGYLLDGSFGQRRIPAPTRAVESASALFDGLFAMAQDDLAKDSVTAIRDDAFDHGRPIACVCFETGAQWHYVWTRDLAYAIDLGLWRFDPLRARNGLRFKLSGVRGDKEATALYPMQDTGSGGSWPVSTDRVVWFLGARHLLDESAFAQATYTALIATLAQDRQYAFVPRMGLYRGETSFLDWRQQSYPAWTASNVVPIADSFALSTNVLHYQALRLAATLAARHRVQTRAAEYTRQATALRAAINARFWRADRGLYASYIDADGTPVNSYDLLGIALAIDSGVATGARARAALANYPSWPAGSPVIWPERADQPIYHNRAIWPFVSAYALRAARRLDDPARIAHEIDSILRGAALAGSNMENYELLSQRIHVEDGKLSGPVVDSPRQLWSVAAALMAVEEGVFGLQADGRIEPKLPVSLLPMLFKDRPDIRLHLPGRMIILQRPAGFDPARDDRNLLVAGDIHVEAAVTTVQLRPVRVPEVAIRIAAPFSAPAAPAAPQLRVVRDGIAVSAAGRWVAYLNGRRVGTFDSRTVLPWRKGRACVHLARPGEHGLESLPSPSVCVGDVQAVAGTWPRHWQAPASGDYRVWLQYDNPHGPINTGITAAVNWLHIDCDDTPPQRMVLVLPHSAGTQASTRGHFHARAGSRCRFTLEPGFNMSQLANFAHYTGGAGGIDGVVNDARVKALMITALPSESQQP
ncbi:MAG TPA: Six-hairpin glycosidase-like protein [Rhodanobacteraceae bacterium]|nr:Six-hairpin glycosidase-like protein [Rhodanobacteraceae bacterium]